MLKLKEGNFTENLKICYTLCRCFVYTSQDILMMYSLQNIVKRFSDTSTVTRYSFTTKCIIVNGLCNSLFSCPQKEDGGWGLHIEGHSTMFCTALNYICMRILGESTDGGHANACRRAREWIHVHGGVTYIPSWGKTWLSVSFQIIC